MTTTIEISPEKNTHKGTENICGSVVKTHIKSHKSSAKLGSPLPFKKF